LFFFLVIAILLVAARNAVEQKYVGRKKNCQKFHGANVGKRFLLGRMLLIRRVGQNKCEAGGWACGWVASLLFCGGWVELV